MKSNRHERIIEIISTQDIETQEELARILREEGYEVTQATISRDIRQLKLTKVSLSNGHQKYALTKNDTSFADKYTRIMKDSFISADTAQNLVVIRTVSGMAMTAGAALDNMNLTGFMGCVAGDDTVLVVARNNEEAAAFLRELKSIIY